MEPKGTGSSTKYIISIVILALLLLGVSVFAYTTFQSRQDYKNNLSQKVNVAVAAAQKVQAAKLQQQFDEQSKSPNKTYLGPATYGSVTFSYPKSWSAYVEESQQTQPINGYFHPAQVPGTQSGAAYALRLEVVTASYSQVLQQYSSDIASGDIKASAYIPAKMKNTANAQVGTRLDGAIETTSDGSNVNGSMVILSVRDKTLKIYTESNDFLDDFNNIILPSLSYIP